MEWAVHWFHVVVLSSALYGSVFVTFLIEDHRWVHAFGVPVEVATFFEERRLGEVRRINEFISFFFVANA
ncbi:unannotated protein [freshwater metagenome]|uniref:Unannotated protein n=1 Tax=freshwater metagenome TaxID=449393 RepID=A0A6J7SQL2_9ZZZZ